MQLASLSTGSLPRRRPQSLVTRLRTPAVVVAAVLWGITLPALFDSALAQKFGVDFVHYYTLGWLALHGSGPVLYDPAALHAIQATLVPSLASLEYPTVYPPQFAVLLAPFALLPYSVASVIWVGVTAVVYFVVISHAADRLQQLPADRVLLWAAAVAFPPFWYLVLFRQNSIIVLATLFVGSRLLERKESGLAGFALGFLAIKPQFGIPFAVLALYRRDWRLILGALISVLVQSAMAVGVFGVDVIVDFFRNLPGVVASANEIEPIYKSLALRTLSRLLPSPIGEAMWVTACIAVLVAMLRVCQAHVPVRLSLSVVILASVLVNPHVYVYDGVVLALPFIWLAEWRLEREEGRVLLYQVTGFCSAAILMMPVALVFGSSAAVLPTMLAIVALVALFVSAVNDLNAQYSDARVGSLQPRVV